VFPDNLQGMPSERAIELQPGIASIAMSPYWMTRVEFVELKIQLKDLLNKGYIQPSSSPWGSPALFVKKDEALHLFLDY
jgi:hypothetical protein